MQVAQLKHNPVMEQKDEINKGGAIERDLKRHFGGVTEFTLDYSTPQKLHESKMFRHFHQRMLRAYLKGKSVFNFGYKTIEIKDGLFEYERDKFGRLIQNQYHVLVKWE